MGRFFSFWWLCARRAFWGNTAFANDWQWVFGIPVLAFGAGLLNSRYQVAELTTGSPIVDAFLAALAAFVVTWLAAFFVRMLNQPVVLYDELKEIVDSTVEEPSAFELAVGESGPSFNTAGGLYDTKRTFLVAVKNVHASSNLAQCKISILKIEGQTEYEGPWVLKDDFGLAAGDTIYVPLVRYGEARDPKAYSCADTFFSVLVDKNAPQLDVDKDYIFTIRATSPRTGPHDFRCKVWVEDGRFRIASVMPRTRQETLNDIGQQRIKETEIRNRAVKSDDQFETWKKELLRLRDDIASNVLACSSHAEKDSFSTVGNLSHPVPHGIEVFNPEHQTLLRIATRDLDWIADFIKSYRN